MAKSAAIAMEKTRSILLGSNGIARAHRELSSGLSMEAPTEITPDNVYSVNAPPDTAERSKRVRYPCLYVYCERVTNSLREKFRTFSGKVQMVLEVRVSSDRLESMERQVQLQAEILTAVLDENRGDWGEGLFHAGEYEVVFGPVKHGGSNYLQSARIVFALELSR